MPSQPPLLLALFALVGVGFSQLEVQNSSPHDYPGKPNGDFSPEWQDYFLVKDALPGVSFSLSRSWAGNIPVNRTNHPNDTLFFWGFESKDGSLTAAADANSSEPWAIWINGGPGASSMLGMLVENGPLHVTDSGSIVPNNVSWDKLVDYIWVDQPVGTGYSTAESDGGYIVDEDQMAEDFISFLKNLVKIFPSLATGPLIITGESYAGTYIPYIAKAIFSAQNPPVKLSKIAIGNGDMGSTGESNQLPILSVIETFPQLIGCDTDVYLYFKDQAHLCGYDFNLTYPQTSKFPPVGPTIEPTEQSRAVVLARRSPVLTRKRLLAIAHGVVSLETGLVKHESAQSRSEIIERERRRHAWVNEKTRSKGTKAKRDLSGRANGTIDSHYGCFLNVEIEDYAINFSLPWNLSRTYALALDDEFGPFDVYNIPDARAPSPSPDPTAFLNDNRTRMALHAPTSKNWTLGIVYPFNSSLDIGPSANVFGDPSVEPIAFSDELATNASERNVSVIIYSGNDDSVIPHFSSEITIQNTTFGGIQGFTRKPSTSFTDDFGNFAGILHQERNWTFVLIAHAGHQVPEFAPEAAFVFFREFVLGNNSTGLVTNTSGSVSVIGGEDPSLLVGDILPGETGIPFGSFSATSTFVYPSATIASWNSFFATAQTAAASAFTNFSSGSASSGSTTGSVSSSSPSSTSDGLRVQGEVPRLVSLIQVLVIMIMGYMMRDFF